MASVINLPALEHGAPLPKGREFYGAIRQKFCERGLAFGEVVHGAERKVPMHMHETSYFSLVLSGGYDESHARERIYYQPFHAAFIRAGTKHDGHIAPHGTRIFTVEIGQAWIEQLHEWQIEPDTVQDLSGGPLSSLGIQLYTEYRMQSASSSLAIDALLWELLAAAAGETQRVESKPIWWVRVIELLHAEFKRSLRISEIAAEARVHPVHLARTFRRICRQTPGEYIQRLRVRFAAEMLGTTREDIAGIAADAGFADQNHLTRIFKRYTRMTPGAFRRAVAS